MFTLREGVGDPDLLDAGDFRRKEKNFDIPADRSSRGRCVCVFGTSETSAEDESLSDEEKSSRFITGTRPRQIIMRRKLEPKMEADGENGHSRNDTGAVRQSAISTSSEVPDDHPVAYPAGKIQQQKSVNGRYHTEYMDNKASHAAFGTSGLFPETEGFACTIMDQTIATKNYLKFIVKDGTSD
ncbi:UNVERIFIED_CONTAM: hypothetical protein PYX00_001436 [Menopon gallinae]|uniref:Uncharacterized protein n=1 Tax=Menopon gallinae TaxID=328185 RepID=A0AAW2IE42_9NEOP